MKRPGFLTGLVCQGALFAQSQPPYGNYGKDYNQLAQSLGGGRGGRGIVAMPLPRGETGKPFSATVTTRTTQTLADGTHVSQTTTMLEYRDSEGRVRTETSPPADTASERMSVITIRDPVAGVGYRLDPYRKSAVKLAMPSTPVTEAGGGRGGRGDGPQSSLQTIHTDRNNPNDFVEDLGTMVVNGVPAGGTRITTIIPAGAIGNDREFRSVTERWSSADLNLLVKSVSSDPRFGTTTYELTNISRQPQVPSLFQVPSNYSLVSDSESKLIEGIEFRGLSRASQDTLKAAILSKVGDIYDQEALRRDFTALWKTGRFSDVQMETDPASHGGLIVRFIVTERR